MDSMKEFYENSSKFFDDGLLNVVYFNDDFCICNVSNCNYAIFPFPKSFFQKQNVKKNGYVGFLISKSFVQLVVKDKANIKALVSLDKRELGNISFRLSEKNYLVFMKNKIKTDLNGPYSEIDFEMEKEISEKSKSR